MLIRYEAGDHVAIYPANDSALVSAIGTFLGVDLDSVFSLVNIEGMNEKSFILFVWSKSFEKQINTFFNGNCQNEEDALKKNPFPCPTTYRTALTYYLDITSLPTTQLIKELAQYASEENERKSLQLMGSSTEEGKVLRVIIVP